MVKAFFFAVFLGELPRIGVISENGVTQKYIINSTCYCVIALQDRNKKHRISGYLEHGEYGKIAEMVMQKLKKEAPRRLLRQILYSL